MIHITYCATLLQPLSQFTAVLKLLNLVTIMLQYVHSPLQKIMGGFLLNKRSKIGFLNAEKSENGFCVSLLNRSIQDLSDHGTSKVLKNLLPEWIRWLL